MSRSYRPITALATAVLLALALNPVDMSLRTLLSTGTDVPAETTLAIAEADDASQAIVETFGGISESRTLGYNLVPFPAIVGGLCANPNDVWTRIGSKVTPHVLDKSALGELLVTEGFVAGGAPDASGEHSVWWKALTRDGIDGSSVFVTVLGDDIEVTSTLSSEDGETTPETCVPADAFPVTPQSDVDRLLSGDGY